jgi:pyrroline-5-carboxylate reductase
MFKLGVVGGGAMGSALLSGITKVELIAPADLYLLETDPDKRDVLQKSFHLNLRNTLAELAEDCSTLILAVKPLIIPAVLKELRSARVDQNHLIISIAAGIPLDSLENQLPKARIVRVMPNTPAKIGKGMTAYCLGQNTLESDRDRVETIFKCVGKVIQIPEHLFDVVTAVSGSGPAYVYQFIESLIDAGVMQGLSRPDAQMLVAETILGSTEMVLQTAEHPAKLRNDVTSPGGTTAAGLFELEKAGFGGILMKAILAATERSKELGRKIG